VSPIGEVRNLAAELASQDPSADLRIGVITAVGTTEAKKVRTDQTGNAWLARSQDIRLAVGDRVWMVRQGSTFIVAGRLSASPGTPTMKAKAANQNVTNTATLVDDTSLAVTLTPGDYRVVLMAHYFSAVDTSDIRSAWDFSGTLSLTGRACIGPGSITTSVLGTSVQSIERSSGHSLGGTVVYGTDAGSTVGIFQEDLAMTVTATGVLTWQWAQGTANASATTVTTASRIYVTPLLRI
jgi:hypothetical protein